MANNAVDDYYVGGSPFDRYEVTSVNPGWKLLASTFGVVALTWLLGTVLRLRKLRHEKRFGTHNFREKIRNRYDESQNPDDKKRKQKEFELLDLDHSNFNLYESRKKFIFEKVSYKNVFYRKRQTIPMQKRTSDKLGRQGSFFSLRVSSKGQSKSKLVEPEPDPVPVAVPEKAVNRDAMYILQSKASSKSSGASQNEYNIMEDKESPTTTPEERLRNNKEDLDREVKEMFNLALP